MWVGQGSAAAGARCGLRQRAGGAPEPAKLVAGAQPAGAALVRLANAAGSPRADGRGRPCIGVALNKMRCTVDLLDWSSLIDSRTKLSKHLVVPNAQTGQLEPLLSRFTEEEEELQMTRMLQRMDVLAKKATEMGVRLMVDAEQTYFQPAISRLTLEMQRKFNVEKALIFNTYQCYLKDAYDNVTLDVELAHCEGWCFGAKLVRGAYLAQERARAAEIGYEDLINPTYEATNAMYHRCLDYVLEELKHNAKAKVMVASHNEDTVRFALHR
ncbi:proline dehydrogenase 1, mitochondrial-like [Pongo pygmaeus]|uniref:proline dehydrogenase 1, mitochondrial-like n=1 Tax=Pongo pygmaeus TaxID=9600 RepID=UPI00300C022C